MADETVGDAQVVDGPVVDEPVVEDPAVDALRTAVARTARILAAEGLVGAFGHVSARLAGDGVAITSTRPLFAAQAADVVVLDAAGRAVAGAVDDVPLETWLHLAVYAARPDVHAICRGHSPYAVVWGTGTADLPVLHGLGLLAGAHVGVHDDVALVRSAERGAAVAAALGADDALLLRGNGALAVGADPLEAAVRLLALEERAQVAVLANGVLAPGAPAPTDVKAAAWAARAGDTPVELRRAARWLDHRHGPSVGPHAKETSC